jgi:alpha(1,3/1,4) fucosyltransferase
VQQPRPYKIGFVDTFEGLSAPFFMDLLSRRYDVIRDDENAEILFFGDENFGTENLKYNTRSVFKIFFTGENRRWTNYHAHAGITFDHDESPNHFRLPLYVVEQWGLTNQHTGYGPLESVHVQQVPEKSEFCCYINSNPNCLERNLFFSKLSMYKQVKSYGPHLNNVGYVVPRGTRRKTDVMEKHKFAICYENGSHPGYVTEKLVHAFHSRTVPIYWGSPTVELDFDDDSYISRHNYNSDDEMIEDIKTLDNDDYLYNKMLSKSVFTDHTFKMFDMNRFYTWFDNIVQVRYFGAKYDRP